MSELRVLALEPYYGGSHRAFLDAWAQNSRHAWTLETLPARHWKWRMRGSAMWFADRLRDAPAGRSDVIFTCDLTAVADLRALLPTHLRTLPIVCYFHENQLTYPLSPDDWRDYQYAFTNITSALAADAVWFNSQAHRAAFLAAAGELLRQMPDAVPADIAATIARRAQVCYPAVQAPRTAHNTTHNRRLRILWCHRWEFDKNPEAFFGVMLRLQSAGADFELVLVGEQFRTAPKAFETGLAALAGRIVHAGYEPQRSEYEQLLAGCDVVVSTAIQENFGIAVVEAVLAGCWPLLPNRLSYPELLPDWARPPCLYASEDDLFERLLAMCVKPDPEPDRSERLRRLSAHFADQFGTPSQAPRLDAALEEVVRAAQAQA